MTAPDGVHDTEEQETLYQKVQSSDEFVALRKRFLSFVMPMTALFIVWYALYVLLATYAASFMAQPVFGSVNVGMLLGLGQFVSTFAITTAYVQWTNKSFDPAAEKLRNVVESSEEAK